MAARKKTSPAADDAAPGVRPAPRAVLGRLVLRVMPMLCLFTMMGTGLHALWQEALADPLFVVAPDAVALTQTGTGTSDLAGIAQAVEGRNLMDPYALSRFRQTLERNAWIERIDVCRRILPNRVHASFRVREPFAQVWNRGEYTRISRDSVALPTENRHEPAGELPIIQCDSAPRPAVGAVWEADGIRDALAVLEFFHQSPVGARLDIRIVHAVERPYLTPELRRKSTRPSLELLTAEGAIIRWGERREARLADGALLETEKMDLLRRALEFSPPLRHGNVLDVRTRSMTYSDATP